jgi:hypothetical protein
VNTFEVAVRQPVSATTVVPSKSTPHVPLCLKVYRSVARSEVPSITSIAFGSRTTMEPFAVAKFL